MGLLSYVRQGMDSLDRHETANTREIEALFLEKPWFSRYRALSVIRQGLATEWLCASAPEDLGLDKPFYKLCEASQEHGRWLALPMTPRWLTQVGLTEAHVERRCSEPPIDIYKIETLPSGLSVVSPHVNAVGIFYGAGTGIIRQTNLSKDLVLRAKVEQAVRDFRRKRDGNS